VFFRSESGASESWTHGRDRVRAKLREGITSLKNKKPVPSQRKIFSKETGFLCVFSLFISLFAIYKTVLEI